MPTSSCSTISMTEVFRSAASAGIYENLSSILLLGTDYALNLPGNPWRASRWICCPIAALSAPLQRFFGALRRMRTIAQNSFYQKIVTICVDDSITPWLQSWPPRREAGSTSATRLK